MPEIRVAAVILAAGASTRLGQPKQLIQIEGESLLHRTGRLALEAGCSPVVVVLGFSAEQMQSEVADLPVCAIRADDWQEGMAASLRAGITAVQDHESSAGAALLLVCDQPKLDLNHLTALLWQHRQRLAPITASLYAGSLGVPAVFSAALFPALLELQGEGGAKTVIRRSGTAAHWVPWPEGTLDIDTPEDLTAIGLQ